MNAASRPPARLPSHTTTQFLSIAPQEILPLSLAQTMRALPVNSSAPQHSTSSRPRQNNRPPSTRCTPNGRVASPRNIPKNAPPNAMNMPANTASTNVRETGVATLPSATASALASIAAGARASGDIAATCLSDSSFIERSPLRFLSRTRACIQALFRVAQSHLPANPEGQTSIQRAAKGQAGGTMQPVGGKGRRKTVRPRHPKGMPRPAPVAGKAVGPPDRQMVPPTPAARR